jgi:hypothetical protein
VRLAVIILCAISIVLLITTGTLGMKLRAGEESVRKIHFHVAMTSASLSIIAQMLSIAFALKNKDEAGTKAA